MPDFRHAPSECGCEPGCRLSKRNLETARLLEVDEVIELPALNAFLDCPAARVWRAAALSSSPRVLGEIEPE